MHVFCNKLLYNLQYHFSRMEKKYRATIKCLRVFFVKRLVTLFQINHGDSGIYENIGVVRFNNVQSVIPCFLTDAHVRLGNLLSI